MMLKKLAQLNVPKYTQNGINFYKELYLLLIIYFLSYIMFSNLYLYE